MNNTERELKMSLSKTEYDELLNVGGAQPKLQLNYYFYCDSMPNDVMLRIRKKDGKYLFCYKKLLSSSNGVNVCDERERELDCDYAAKLLDGGITSAVLKQLVDVDLPYAFACVGSLSTYRAKFALDKWIIELDKNEYLGFTDYELECECSSDELLGKLKDYLLYNFGITFKRSLPKSERFLKKFKGD